MFTEDEANGLLPALSDSLRQIQQAREVILAGAEHIRRSASLDGGGRFSQEYWDALHAMRTQLEALAEQGIILRDADSGLVDFPSRREGRDIRAIPLTSIPLFGTHNVENVMTALLVADLCGVPLPRAERALADFRGLPHRLEKVRELDGVTWYNDSKATNVAATMKSLESFAGGIVLILGGKDKGGDFTRLVPLIRERVAHLVLMGKAREVIAAQVGSIVPTTKVATLKEAVEAAWVEAGPGGVVLLAPACASFDQYSGFEERGEDFRGLVQALRPRS